MDSVRRAGQFVLLLVIVLCCPSIGHGRALSPAAAACGDVGRPVAEVHAPRLRGHDRRRLGL